MGRLEAVGVNAPQIEYWNGPAGDRWASLADSQSAGRRFESCRAHQAFSRKNQ